MIPSRIKPHSVVKAALEVAGQKRASQESILSFVSSFRALKSVVDFGCGRDAKWLHTARKLGVAEIRGYDVPGIPLAELGLAPAEYLGVDLTKEVKLERKFDLAISLEVAEHLPSSAARTFIQSLTNASDWVLFGAAVPYQGGRAHVNENWIEYWAKLFEHAGFVCYDILRIKFWHDASIIYYYRQNTCLYVKSGFDQSLASRGYVPSARPPSLIHPDLYLKAVSTRPPPNQNVAADVKDYYQYAFDNSMPRDNQLTYGLASGTVKHRTEIAGRPISIMKSYPPVTDNSAGFFDFLIGRPRYRAGMVRRLNLRHRFLVQPFEHEIRGSRVLDLAAHDGRWAYAYAGAGAASVVGYEARQHLVDEFEQYPDKDFKKNVRLQVTDIFDALENLKRSNSIVDIIAVLGIFYHIMDHYRLLKLIHRLRPRLVIIDSEFMVATWPHIVLGFEDPAKDLNAYAANGETKVPVGTPSRGALEKMAESLNYKVDWLNWETVGETERGLVQGYFRAGPRRRFTCTLRPTK
jgi:2-polyprenyl-3-methyl-5-hydroxy-6-metoxy-1,4-benzoquinol methylase